MLLSDDHRAVQDAVRSFVRAEIAPHGGVGPAGAVSGRRAARAGGTGLHGVAVPPNGRRRDGHVGAGFDLEGSPPATAQRALSSASTMPVCAILRPSAAPSKKSAGSAAGARRDARRLLTHEPTSAASDGADDNGAGALPTNKCSTASSVRHSGKNRRGDRQAVTERPPASAVSAPSSCRPTTCGYVVRASRTSSATASETAQIRFENCRIPVATDSATKGRVCHRAGRTRGRAHRIASQAVACARGLDAARPTAAPRRLRRPIFEHQAVQFKLPEMAVRVEAARQSPGCSVAEGPGRRA